ncbi:MAG: hypothetical protein EBY09_09595 [Verrucomicrobia bacterium]|nr:hypothetical protein [Verrucomicrobiota bacterium]
MRPGTQHLVRGTGAGDAQGLRQRRSHLGSAVEVFSIHSRAGTPSYLAPERFRGSTISERTEIYAIGVTLYEALTGVCPFGEIERFQTPSFDTVPKPAARLNPSVPPWLDSILQRALSVHLENRYHAFSEMAYELEHPERFARVISFIEKKIVPIVLRHAISGVAHINAEDPVLEDPLSLAMLIDVFSERGYHAVVDIHRIEVPEQVDLATGQIRCRTKKVYRIQIRFHGSEIRRG